MHPRILKELATPVSEPLAKLFNMSIQCMELPDEWKGAVISAIFKKGNKSLAENYRPVNLTSLE